jgi:hypothetical protein
VPQGLLGNAILEAFAAAYDPRIARFRLTDQQLLDEAGIPHAPGHNYFDVRPYVLLPGCHGFAGLADIVGVRDGGHVHETNALAAGLALRGTSAPLMTDPSSFLVLANTVAAGAASHEDWGELWHPAEGPWGGTEALGRLFAEGGLASAGAGG